MLITLFVACLAQRLSFCPYQGTLQRPFCLANSSRSQNSQRVCQPERSSRVTGLGRYEKRCVRLATNNVIFIFNGEKAFLEIALKTHSKPLGDSNEELIWGHFRLYEHYKGVFLGTEAAAKFYFNQRVVFKDYLATTNKRRLCNRDLWLVHLGIIQLRKTFLIQRKKRK